MNLTGTSDLVRIITTSSADIEVQASWADQTETAFTPGRTNTIVTSATTTTIVGSPAASTQRAVTSLKIRNDHAATSNTVTILHTDGTTSVDVWKGTLAAGEAVQYDGKAFTRLTAGGYGVDDATSAAALAAHEADTTSIHGITDTAALALLTNLENAFTNVMMSRLYGIAITFTLVEDTAYFVYVGRLPIARTPLHVEFHNTVSGTGAQTAEVGLFSSPAPPNKAGQTLTKLVATGTVDDLTASPGMKRNTSAFATSVAAGTYLWAGIRTAMATNEPGLAGLGRDNLQGHVLATTTAGALTGAGPWSGAIVALTAVNAVQHPELRVVFA